jgi:rfaE bifunctional protein nucleotidyltransferase chain/domain
MGEVLSRRKAAKRCETFRKEGRKIVFTNGTFDILHRGHVEYLSKARELGDCLFVGLNSDASVSALKGPGRPVIREEDRAFILANLVCVDYVIVFDEDTPLQLIQSLLPDVLVKGGDWKKQDIVGKDTVERHGGDVVTIELTPGRSSTSIIETILKRASYFQQ